MACISGTGLAGVRTSSGATQHPARRTGSMDAPIATAAHQFATVLKLDSAPPLRVRIYRSQPSQPALADRLPGKVSPHPTLSTWTADRLGIKASFERKL